MLNLHVTEKYLINYIKFNQSIVYISKLSQNILKPFETYFVRC